MGEDSGNRSRILWSPSPEFSGNSRMRRYIMWLNDRKYTNATNYESVWKWSVENTAEFWKSIMEFFGIGTAETGMVIPKITMPGAKWFPGSTVNYAEYVFRNRTKTTPAIVSLNEEGETRQIGWDQLARDVASFSGFLISRGVTKGDRVAALMPNVPETVVAFLATVSIGAIWSSCSPDLGPAGIRDRFRQIDPVVLITVSGYRFNGKFYDKSQVVDEVIRSIPSIRSVVVSGNLGGIGEGFIPWEETMKVRGDLQFVKVNFDHPLWILYSSGTTGLPKAIVHGHGGILLEHLKTLALHFNLESSDRFFWYTTTSWMMWNIQVSGLLTGATIILYDGSPVFPDLWTMWKMIDDHGITVFGTSASYIMSSMKNGLVPRTRFYFRSLKAMGYTASPLPPEGFRWVYESVKSDLWFAGTSGGTDICSGFVGGNPLLPVREGEMQCRMLGASVFAFDEGGRAVTDQVGEMVVTRPMPSMPLYFWNDPDSRRYSDSYFSTYPGVWRQGDWIRILPPGGIIISGRSDSTLNRHGVRMGTGEIYSAVENVEEVQDSLVVGIETEGGGYYMPIFVVLREGITLDDTIRMKIKGAIRKELSPRHVPDEIIQVGGIPKTLNGKKLEIPVKRILLTGKVEGAVSIDSVANPHTLEEYIEISRNRMPR
ncbi:MAG: acetoacetate--CoA ligase [Thermoplasmataceae archaeon]